MSNLRYCLVCLDCNLECTNKNEYHEHEGHELTIIQVDNYEKN